MKKIWYSIPEYEVTRFVETDDSAKTNRYLAEICAKNYFYREGMIGAANWPLVFVLLEDEDGPEIERFEVDIESVPEFHASKIKD